MRCIALNDMDSLFYEGHFIHGSLFGLPLQNSPSRCFPAFLAPLLVGLLVSFVGVWLGVGFVWLGVVASSVMRVFVGESVGVVEGCV